MKKVKGLAVIAFLVVTLIGMLVVVQPVGASATPADVGDDLTALLERAGEFFAWLWGQFEVKFIICHVCINMVTALAAAIKLGDFKFYKLFEFLYRKLLPYVMLYAVFRVVGQSVGFEPAAVFVFGLIEVALWADLIENLGRMGLKLPEGIRKAVSKA